MTQELAHVDLLDHGYAKLLLTWGDDSFLVESARMSTGKGFLGWGPKECVYQTTEEAVTGGDNHAHCPKCKGKGHVGGDEKLLRRLYTSKPKHTSPFEFGGLVVEVQAPIFVFREWHRHRTQSYNEMSARYTVLPELFYVPSVERLMLGSQSTTNKQGSEGGFTPSDAEYFQREIRIAYNQSASAYDRLLKNNVARELARVVVPVGQYSRMRAQANLWNWLHFLTLRMDPAAQWEIRQYANVVGQWVQQYFPRTWELFTEPAARTELTDEEWLALFYEFGMRPRDVADVDLAAWRAAIQQRLTGAST